MRETIQPKKLKAESMGKIAAIGKNKQIPLNIQPFYGRSFKDG
ncbi:hypothetical protein [Niallia sp. FSL M8-0099]